MDRTLIICKPDAVERGLVGEILGRFERRNLRLVTLDLREVEQSVAAAHYAEHDGKPFYADLIAFITRSPVVVGVVEGPEDTWKVVRTMMGATNPRDSAPGTIRGDLAIELSENLIHGSDSAESAAREIGIWFPDLAG
jgi:nucleoside-diphosphate kinase